MVLVRMLARRPVSTVLRCKQYSTDSAAVIEERYQAHQSIDEKMATGLLIQQRAMEPKRPLQLHRLVRFKDMNPVPEKALLANAREAIGEITVTLAQRLEALRALPYMVVLNPYISRIYHIYYSSFRVMNSMSPPRNLEENRNIVAILESLVDAHMHTIPTLAKGFSEARKFLKPDHIDKVLHANLQGRMAARLLAEHHIALSDPIGPNFVGSIQTDLNPATLIKQCAEVVGDICNLKYGVVPDVVFELGEEVKIAYVPVHLEYICTELLKNSFRAVCENNTATKHPIVVTVIPTGSGVIIRFRDRGGGILPEVEKNIFHFSYTTFENDQENPIGELEIHSGSTIAGLGYGLPLSRSYAEFFGGKLQVQSYYGWGTDVYLTLKSPMVSGYHREVQL